MAVMIGVDPHKASLTAARLAAGPATRCRSAKLSLTYNRNWAPGCGCWQPATSTRSAVPTTTKATTTAQRGDLTPWWLAKQLNPGAVKASLGRP